MGTSGVRKIDAFLQPCVICEQPLTHKKISRRAKIFRIATLACYRGFWASEHIIDPYSSGRMRGSDGGQVCVGVQIMLGDGFKILVLDHI